MELYIWKGDFGLPSVNPDCLSVLAYCSFSGVKPEIKCTHPLKIYSGTLPVFVQSGVRLTEVQDIFNHLRKQNNEAEFRLTNKQSADILAYNALVRQRLTPALVHTLWVDQPNYESVTRPLYASTFIFPVGVIMAARMSKLADDQLAALLGTDVLSRTEQVIEDAKACIHLLSDALGDKDYFFDKSPTSLDAVVFGHLAPLLKAPLRTDVLQKYLEQYPNLVGFVRRVLDKYFPMTEREADALSDAEAKRTKERQEALNFPNKKRNMIVSASLALAVMGIFALGTGIVTLPGISTDTSPKRL